MEESAVVPFDEFHLQFNSQIPFDLFVSKKRKGFGNRGFLRLTDSKGNLVYKVQRATSKSSDCVKLVVDSSSNTLLSVKRVDKGSWKGFRGDMINGDSNFIFKVDRTLNQLNRTEFDVLLVGDHGEGSKTELKMKGCPFTRACTVYKGDSIMAESNLMYKLGIRNIYIPRNRFRVTIFPGVVDHSLIVSLIAIFFDGRRIWM